MRLMGILFGERTSGKGHRVVLGSVISKLFMFSLVRFDQFCIDQQSKNRQQKLCDQFTYSKIHWSLSCQDEPLLPLFWRWGVQILAYGEKRKYSLPCEGVRG